MCIVFIILFVIKIDIVNDKNKIIEDLQIQLNESIEMQNQMKIDYEEQMLEIATNDTAAKNYVINHKKTNIFVRYEYDDKIHYILQINSDGEVLTAHRTFIREDGYK